MAEYWPSYFLRVYGLRWGQRIHNSHVASAGLNISVQ